MLKANKNFHTHTIFCDGKSTAEEMVRSAIDCGLEALGFSAHSYAEYDVSCGLPLEDMEAYKAEIMRLKDKYKDKIAIYYGIEFDCYSEIDTSEFEYTIASVHAVKKNGKYYIVDESEEKLIENVNKGWDGDYYAFAKDYFELVASQEGDILGHIDLICKFNENDKIFSTKDERYLKYAEEAIKKIVAKGMLIEMNTGAMSRGYRSTPYPSEDILRLIKKHGGKITINSDSHHKDSVTCGFDISCELAEKCGFDEISYLF